MSAQGGGMAAILATAGVCCLLASRIDAGRGREVWLAIVGCLLIGFAVAAVAGEVKRWLTRSHGGGDVD